MMDKDVIMNIKKVISYSGPHKTPVYSAARPVYGTLKDAGADEKERAKASGMETVLRVDINEEEFSGETSASIGGTEYNIYKYAKVNNKVYLYLAIKGQG